MRIAIIPARGGSKRIPKKNIKSFCGQPMIAYPIAAAKASNLFDHIIVSTDCKSIKEVAESCGAEVPFTRPEHLSDDFTGTGAVVNHAIDWFKANVCEPDFVCCIYPTAPFLRATDLIDAYEKLVQCSDKSFCFSVGRYAFPVQRALTFDEQGDIGMLFPEHAGTRSQDLKEVFHDAGQFYFGRAAAFLSHVATFGPASIPYFMPRERVMDIDDEEDWQQAEMMFELLTTKESL
jgi:N-acylneuraminate cytidylyltransferase